MNYYEFYKSELEKKKTISSKKSFLTKSENQVQEYLNDLMKHKKPSGNMKFGYLYGEPVTPSKIATVKTELQVIKNLKKQLESQNQSTKVIKSNPSLKKYNDLIKTYKKQKTRANILAQYTANELVNSHTENLVLMAFHFGTKTELARAKKIFIDYEKNGYAIRSNERIKAETSANEYYHQLLENKGIKAPAKKTEPKNEIVMSKKNNKYRYYKVIQQNYGQGFEDVSEYEAKSNGETIEYDNKLDAKGRKVKLITNDLKEYKLMGYPTRVVFRKELLKPSSMKAPAKKTTAKRKTAPKKTGIRSSSKTLTPAEKRKRTIARKNRQTGSTDVSLDKQKKALRPGKRISASGNVYYERRANRSDVGKLLAPVCVRRNPDGSTTTYSAQHGTDCNYGGKIQPTRSVVKTASLSGAKSKAKKKPTSAQLKARAEFTKKQAQARKLVDSGKAKTMRSAWAMLK